MGALGRGPGRGRGGGPGQERAVSWSGLVGDVAGVGYGDVKAVSFLGDAQGADDDDVVAGEVTDAGVEVVLDAERLVVADHDGGGVLGSGAGLGHHVQEDALGGGVFGVVGDLAVETRAQALVSGREGVGEPHELVDEAGALAGQLDEGVRVEAAVQGPGEQGGQRCGRSCGGVSSAVGSRLGGGHGAAGGLGTAGGRRRIRAGSCSRGNEKQRGSLVTGAGGCGAVTVAFDSTLGGVALVAAGDVLPGPEVGAHVLGLQRPGANGSSACPAVGVLTWTGQVLWRVGKGRVLADAEQSSLTECVAHGGAPFLEHDGPSVVDSLGCVGRSVIAPAKPKDEFCRPRRPSDGGTSPGRGGKAPGLVPYHPGPNCSCDLRQESLRRDSRWSREGASA